MMIQEYISKNLSFQKHILDLLDSEGEFENNFQKLVKLINDQNILNDKNELKTILYLIVKISSHYHRSALFFPRIERIILLFKKEILKYYSNLEVFNIFQESKRLLLFLIEEKIFTIDDTVFSILQGYQYKKSNYLKYLKPEIDSYLERIQIKEEEKEEEEELKNKGDRNEEEEINEEFFEKRKIGENPKTICEIIRKDMVKDFIIYVNKNNTPLGSKIKPSIFETNKYLYSKSPTLIEYAAFFGSIQIFQYLKINNVNLNSSLWFYAIYGNNPEIIHMIEENQIKPKNCSYEKCMMKSMKCHHFQMSEYFLNYYLNGQISDKIFSKALKNYDFNYIMFDMINKKTIPDACKFDYYYIVKYLNDSGINLYKTSIFLQFFMKFGNLFFLIQFLL